jgi:hypothetical protein
MDAGHVPKTADEYLDAGRRIIEATTEQALKDAKAKLSKRKRAPQK